MALKSETEIRAQLAETQKFIQQLEAQMVAARNQEWALQFVLGEVSLPTPETEEEEPINTGYSDLSNPEHPMYGMPQQPLELD